ncbi:MAG: AAA family ATPase [Gemmatimonadota bacterium]|nr:AAA family ATPase [Gemmatimonadota bacterium]MDH5758889.1 AAA family ATPase [Gemmatimonadota bacterium]
MPQDTLHDLGLLIRSRHGLVNIETHEDDRAEGLLRHLADGLRLPFFTWSRVRGLVRDGMGDPIYDTKDALKAVRHIGAARIPAVYFMRGLSGAVEGNELLAEYLREATVTMKSVDGAVVLTTDGSELPGALRTMAAHVTLPGPSDEEFRSLLNQIVRDISQRQTVEVDLSREESDTLIRNLSGLTLMEAEKILTKAIVEDGALNAGDIQHVIDHKKKVVEREGLLEYYPVETSLADIADLATLKAWLAKRTAVVRNPGDADRFGLDFPKGVLLLGVPGCGKSLSAKAVSAEWGLPLLKLDPSNLYNKYIGESEGNFKRAMKAAERMAPVVLWIDELEKAFATGGSEDGGVSQRILGSFLSWMQDRTGEVFVVATANDISRLPPEFLRKGRFDEIFFVDLPDGITRQKVFEIHLASRGHDPERFDLLALAEATSGFSGSEIEEVVVSALYTAFAEETEIDTGALHREVAATRPLSSTMAEKIAGMREWARDRTVRAN